MCGFRKGDLGPYRFPCLLLAILVPWGACRGTGGRGLARDPSQRRTRNAGSITATDAPASSVNGYIYESLIRRNERTLELELRLADSWEISDDHLTYTFHLKKGIKWEDGHPFTAKDILFSFERIRDPKVDAAHQRNYYQDIEKLEVLDDYTVRYRYRMPYFKALEFCGGIDIVPAHLFKEGDDFNQHPIGRKPLGMVHIAFFDGIPARKSFWSATRTIGVRNLT